MAKSLNFFAYKIITSTHLWNLWIKFSLSVAKIFGQELKKQSVTDLDNIKMRYENK